MSRGPSRGRHRVVRGRQAGPRHARASAGRHGRTGPRGRRPSLVAATTAALLVVGTGAAVAAWLATGSGSASGQAMAAQPVVIAAASPAAAELYPGGSGSVKLTASNPNPYPVRLTQASFGAVTVAPVSGRTCAATSSNVAPVSAGPVTLGTPVDLAAGAASVPVVIPNALTMPTTAENGCQDATITVAVTLTGTST